MTTTHSLQIHATPYRQFPLRLPHEIANELDRISKHTRITKTKISRIAVEKFLDEMKRSGADELLNDLCEVQ
jgi:predicted DNA-binding protein